MKHTYKPKSKTKVTVRRSRATPESQMAMNRPVTRDVYVAREIAQPAPDTRKQNQKSLDTFQSSMAPIRHAGQV